MNDDLISREEVGYYIQSYIHEIITESGTDKNEHTNSILRAILNGIKTMPSVTPKAKMGRWINLEETKYKGQVLPFWGRYGCSKCGGHGEGTFNYCPNCGAKMKAKEAKADDSN